MIDYDILNKYGTTSERLRKVFTATVPENVKELKQEEQDCIEKDCKTRKYFEELIGNRLIEHMQFSLQNHSLYSAVDLAWDSAPINKTAYPLMLYAQGKLDLGQTAESLTKAGFGKYVEKNAEGKVSSIHMPKFFEVHVNLIRSVITRRLAAQANKYNNLFPCYKYESRSTSLVGKLRADVMSQVSDIMADNYDYRHHDVQVMRDMFLYAHSIDFVRSAWECEKQWRKKTVSDELETKEFEIEEVIVKEGVAFINPHPTRTFSDNTYPLASINSDSGCEYLGFWDVGRYKDIANNTKYWNRTDVSFSEAIVNLFSSYSQYFGQHYCTINPPSVTTPGGFSTPDLSGANDRSNNVGRYSGTQADASMIHANYFQKLTPKEHNLGDYPYPVWMRFMVAGHNTIIYSEVLPSTPGAYCGYNENDSRQVNISFAHELMGYQDQMTNLLSHLLLVMQSDNIRVMIIDSDAATPELIKAFKSQLKGDQAYTGTTVLEVSRSKMQELGFKPEDIISLKETKPAALEMIFRAIGQLVQLVERLMAMSPQEQGQPAPREISATETNLLAGTTESVYGFISDSIDEFRAAKKRIIYESYLAKGNQNLRVPVLNRYSRKVITAAGFEAVDGEHENTNREGDSDVMAYTVIGTKAKLEHDYIFTSRDGAERPVNTQAANVLVQLLATIQDPEMRRAMGKEKVFEIMNEIFRLSGSGFDLKLELKEGEGDAFEMDDAQLQPILQQLEELTKAVTELATITRTNAQEIINMKGPAAGQPMPIAA